jgi:hypothetical protein
MLIACSLLVVDGFGFGGGGEKLRQKGFGQVLCGDDRRRKIPFRRKKIPIISD